MPPRNLFTLIALVCLGGATATPASADEGFSLLSWVSDPLETAAPCLQHAHLPKYRAKIVDWTNHLRAAGALAETAALTDDHALMGTGLLTGERKYHDAAMLIAHAQGFLPPENK